MYFKKRGEFKVFVVLSLLVVLLGFLAVSGVLGDGIVGMGSISGAVIGVSGELSVEGELGIMGAPSVGNVTINSTLGTNLTTENLTVYWDTSPQSAKNITNWYLNGTSITVLNMPFENLSGASGLNATKDYSQSSNNGSEYNGVYWNATGGFDGRGAYEFDGTDDYISVPDDDSLDFGTRDFTISVWVKREDNNTTSRIITKKYAVGDNSVGWSLGVSDGKLLFKLSNGTSNNAIASSSDFLDTTWHHVVATRNRSTNLLIYLDGVDDSSGNQVYSHNVTNSKAIRIARDEYGGYLFNGRSDL